jgi:endonuclease/exonuclease/phosphatase family metal-dependent hydrolase
MKTVRALAAVLFLLPVLALADVSASVGDQIELKATHHAGVPLHNQPRGTDDFQRVSDGTRATVLEISSTNGWLQLRISDGREGWISPKYVGRIVSGGDGNHNGNNHGSNNSIPLAEAERRVWSSPAECRQVVQAGNRLPRDFSGTLRVGAWNVRWFPMGCSPSEVCPENRTDVEWLACTIAWMDVDLLAVEEILETQPAVQAMTDLRNRLDALTGGSWQIDLSDCGESGAQRLGFLWNARKVQLSGQADSCELNGAAPEAACTDACVGRLRPGRYARARSTKTGGADFHILAVHFDSGRNNTDYQRRRIADERIPFVEIDDAPLFDTDSDVVVLGDLNTMGREEPPQVSAVEEIEILDEELAPGFARLRPQFQCSEYFQGRGGLLDHILVSTAMQEDGPGTRLTGYCAVERCAPIQGAMPAAYERLSDHCPILFEVIDQDLDEDF